MSIPQIYQQAKRELESYIAFEQSANQKTFNELFDDHVLVDKAYSIIWNITDSIPDYQLQKLLPELLDVSPETNASSPVRVLLKDALNRVLVTEIDKDVMALYKERYIAPKKKM